MKSIVDSIRRGSLVKNRRARLCAVVLGGVLLSAVALPVVLAPPKARQDGYWQHTDAAQPLPTERATAFLDGAGGILEGFSTHLPLVVIDTGGRPVPVHKIYDNEKGYMVSIPSVDPFVPCDLYVYDSGAYNRLSDAPAFRTKATIKRRGNSSHAFEKAQYKLKLLTAQGAENALPLIGMDAEADWVLNGNMLDKSLLRNYMALTVASQTAPYTPDARYCEVLLRDGGGFRYEGVYLLMESVKQGPGRVALHTETPGNGEHSFLLRRDRYDPDRVMLRTYATEKGLSAGYLGVLYPKNDKLTDATLRYIESTVSAVERVLYADDVSVFLTYPDYIDVDSFVNYCVLNEFFGNYDAGWNSTYFYKDLGGKLCVGPVWDYDSILDNYAPEPMDPQIAAFAAAPWFDRLIRDRAFVDRVLTRYAELRRGPLSPHSMDTFIHQVTRYLDPARQRDWLRWQEIYTGAAYALPDAAAPVNAAPANADAPARLHRQSDTYEQEIQKLRHLLRVHSDVIFTALPQMQDPDAASLSAADDYKKNSMLVALFLLVFATAAWIARRHGV